MSGNRNGNQDPTLNVRKLMVEHFKEGKSVRKISELVKRSRSTVHGIIQKYKNDGTLKNKRIASELEIGAEIKVHPETVRNVRATIMVEALVEKFTLTKRIVSGD